MLTARLCALVLRAIQTHRLQDRCLGLSGACPTSSPLYQLAESDAEQTALCVLVKTKEPKIEWHTAVRSGDELAILAKIPSVIPGTLLQTGSGNWGILMS